jgi:hypothetical protein
MGLATYARVPEPTGLTQRSPNRVVNGKAPCGYFTGVGVACSELQPKLGRSPLYEFRREFAGPHARRSPYPTGGMER